MRLICNTGRKEITSFFYSYTLLTVCSLIVDTGVVPPGSNVFPYFVAGQLGLAAATCVCLMINGFVGFQLYEDGTTLSVSLVRGASAAMFAIAFVISILTFKSMAGLGPQNTIALFVVVYIVSAICIAVYVILQIFLIIGTLQERWPLWHIGFGVISFVLGQIILYALSEPICDGVQHYMDGLFFATVLNLLAVMMVYKYWDSITKEDLEFSVGQKMNNWEVKDHKSMFDDDRRNTGYDSDYGNSSSIFHPHNQRGSTYAY
jgi:hypothetical protein